MVNRYMQSQDESVFTSDDLAAMQTVFDTLKVHATYLGRPEALHTLARSIFALYRTTSQEPDRLIEILRCPS